MWFRNLSLYRLTEAVETDLERLEQQLDGHRFHPCGGLDTHSCGWVPPLGRHGQTLLHPANGRLMLCMRREERILPPAVVREILEEKVEQIEADEGRPVGRREKTQLRDEIVVDLLPRAFTRSHLTYAYIDPDAGWIVVDSASAKRAEELLNLLRDSLDTLKIRPLSVNQSPSLLMTRWLESGLPQGFEPGNECELREPVEKGAVVRARNLELIGEEIGSHLEAGMQVTRLAVEWNERVRCVLGDDLVIRRLRFTDLVMEEAADTAAEDAAARFDADFALMSSELAHFFPALIEAMGGLEET